VIGRTNCFSIKNLVRIDAFSRIHEKNAFPQIRKGFFGEGEGRRREREIRAFPRGSSVPHFSTFLAIQNCSQRASAQRPGAGMQQPRAGAAARNAGAAARDAGAGAPAAGATPSGTTAASGCAAFVGGVVRPARSCRRSTQARRAAGGLQHACARSGLCARAQSFCA
jgi:hypothetical protein